MAISFDYSSALSFLKQHEVDYFGEFVKTGHRMLHEKKVRARTIWAGSNFRINMTARSLQELRMRHSASAATRTPWL